MIRMIVKLSIMILVSNLVSYAKSAMLMITVEIVVIKWMIVKVIVNDIGDHIRNYCHDNDLKSDHLEY